MDSVRPVVLEILKFPKFSHFQPFWGEISHLPRGTKLATLLKLFIMVQITVFINKILVSMFVQVMSTAPGLSEIVEVLLFEKMAHRASKYLDIRGISSYTIFVHEVIFPYVGSIRLVLPHKLYNQAQKCRSQEIMALLYWYFFDFSGILRGPRRPP